MLFNRSSVGANASIQALLTETIGYELSGFNAVLFERA